MWNWNNSHMDSQKQENPQAFKEFDVFKICSNKTRFSRSSSYFVVRRQKNKFWVSVNWLLVSILSIWTGSYYSEKSATVLGTANEQRDTWNTVSPTHPELERPTSKSSRAGPCWDQSWSVKTQQLLEAQKGATSGAGLQWDPVVGGPTRLWHNSRSSTEKSEKIPLSLAGGGKWIILEYTVHFSSQGPLLREASCNQSLTRLGIT